MKHSHIAALLAAAGAALVLNTVLPAEAVYADEMEEQSAEESGYLGSGSARGFINGEGEAISSDEDALVGREGLPKSYRTERVTKVQNQSGTDLCWAYSLLDAGQINQMKQGAVDTSELLYSPRHLQLASYLNKGEHFDLPEIYGDGGNYEIGSATLLSWYGAASFQEYGKFEWKEPVNRSDSLSHLVGFEQLPYQFAHDKSGGDPNSQAWSDALAEVKQMVMDNGAVTITYEVHNPDDLPIIRASERSIIYHANVTEETHGSVIVGWDDEKETGAPLPGAFYLKNTWGAYKGEEGYLWLSYYDMSMCDVMVWHFENAPAGTHLDDTLYSYDATGYYQVDQSAEPSTGANVFTARHTAVIDAVGTYLPMNGSYNIRVEKNLTKGIPGSGTVVAEVSGQAKHFGFYTISIPEFEIKKGEQFAVSVSARNESDGNYYVFCEGNTEAAPGENEEYRRITTAGAGQSYLNSVVNGQRLWRDTVSDPTLSSKKYYNVCIKAYGNSVNREEMFRLYNPNSGEHFYTASLAERDNLIRATWNYEGICWTAPSTSDTPVYRLYNPNAGDHHYTTSAAERSHLIQVGWRDEGIGWYSDDEKHVPLYRQYNPNAKSGAHNFTASAGEQKHLVSVGWKAEGIGWYGIKS